MGNKEVKLSVVIPVYNVEKYIEKCLGSLCGLEIANEIIVINDGSSDNSLEIIKKFKNEHENENIIIINQENKGISKTRNVGLRESKGEFIFFLDSDDWVETESFKKMLKENIEKDTDVDIIVGKETRYDENSGETWVGADARTPKELIGKILTGREYFKKGIEHKFLSVRVGIYLYKKEFLEKNNIEFIEEIGTHEDELFLINILSKAQKIKIVDDIFGVYLAREGSTLTTSYDKQTEDVFENCKYLVQKYKTEKDDLIKALVFYRTKRFYKNAMKRAIECDRIDLFYKIHKEFKKDFRETLKYTHAKNFENINFYLLYFLGKYFFIKELIKKKK